jgi:hypothetical protein
MHQETSVIAAELDVRKFLERNSAEFPESELVTERALQRVRIVNAILAHVSATDEPTLHLQVEQVTAHLTIGMEYLLSKDSEATKEKSADGRIGSFLKAGKHLTNMLFTQPLENLTRANRSGTKEPLSMLVDNFINPQATTVPQENLIVSNHIGIAHNWRSRMSSAAFRSLGELKTARLGIAELEEHMNMAEVLGIDQSSIRQHQIAGSRALEMLPECSSASYLELGAFCALFSKAFEVPLDSPFSLHPSALKAWKNALERKPQQVRWALSDAAVKAMEKAALEHYGVSGATIITNLAKQYLQDILELMNNACKEHTHLHQTALEPMFPVHRLSAEALEAKELMEGKSIMERNRQEEIQAAMGNAFPSNLGFYLESDTEFLLQATAQFADPAQWLGALSNATPQQQGEFIAQLLAISTATVFAAKIVILLLSFEPELLRCDEQIASIVTIGTNWNTERLKCFPVIWEALRHVKDKKQKAKLIAQLQTHKGSIGEYVESSMQDWEREQLHPQYGGYDHLRTQEEAYTGELEFLNSTDPGTREWETVLKHLIGKSVKISSWAEILEYYTLTNTISPKKCIKRIERLIGSERLFHTFVYILFIAHNPIAGINGTNEREDGGDEGPNRILINAPLNLFTERGREELDFPKPWERCRPIYKKLTPAARKQLAADFNAHPGFSTDTFEDYYGSHSHVITLDHHSNWQEKDAEAFLFLHSSSDSIVCERLITSLSQRPMRIIRAILSKALPAHAAAILVDILVVRAELKNLEGKKLGAFLKSSKAPFKKPFQQLNAAIGGRQEVLEELDKIRKERYNTPLAAITSLSL